MSSSNCTVRAANAKHISGEGTHSWSATRTNDLPGNSPEYSEYA